MVPIASADTIGYCNRQKADRKHNVENSQVVELNSHSISRIMRTLSIHETHATVKPKRPATRLSFPRKNGTTAPANATCPIHTQISESFSSCISESSIVRKINIFLKMRKPSQFPPSSLPTRIFLHIPLLFPDQVEIQAPV